ncbi:cation:proton antiporter family protein [Marinithermus hydrothermalis]|uniref:Sodium/hydrogen exchanger n=1 Tax=Marinithermus hydrothermalis (strain DSM 14884 / JCM 11576 / T1) TaxID=869210 RepID=F2NLI7_MARHT|nr:cation:proton antiporter family protein [Marinithermus hydrothermalis]AEB12086.1 sodium/hydrogen exchanger [Marinithermus hydrothermalis DSM 14884]
MDVLWIGIAYGMGLLAASVGLPPLVGFLGGGFALGALGFTGGAFLHEVAHTGVLLLLFSVGLKVRLKNLSQPEVWGTGLAHLLVFSALGTLVLGLSGLYWRPALFLGLALAFSSTVMAGKLLEEKRELRAFHGRVVIGILILQDLAAVALLAFAGAGAPSVWALALLGLPVLRPLFIRLLERSGHAELLVLYGIGLALTGARLFETVGLSGELGAIVLGMILADHPRAQELSQSLWSLKEAFLVGFFLEIGLESHLTLETLLTSLGLVLLVPLKAALFFLLLVALNLRARTAFLAALALGSYSEFALITAQLGVASGLLEATWLPLLALTVALSFVITAPVNRAAHGLYERFKTPLLKLERPNRHPDEEPVSLGSARFLVVGMGRTGTAAYQFLREQGEPVAGIDADPGKIQQHRAEGRRVLYGDAEDPALWEGLRLEGLQGVLLTLPDLEARIRAAEHLRRRGFSGLIGATSYYPEEDERLRAVGVTLIFHPFTEAGARLAELGLQALEESPQVA